MKATELLDLLREFYRDKHALRQRHVAGAKYVSHYDFNNTYQYMINRDDGHVRWLADAIVDMGGEPEDAQMPDLKPSGKGPQAEASIMAADRDEAQRFVDKWSPRIETLPNARHRSMLRVILGETLEQKRFFEQGLAGRTDLLGRRADGAGTGGGVLSTRWIEQ